MFEAMKARTYNYYNKLEQAGHVLKKNEDGEVDAWVMEYEYHNGPGCINCHETWCEHCQDEVKPCIGKEEYERRAKAYRYEQYLKLKEEFE